MDIKAERVEQLNCGRCGQVIDPAPHKPLAIIKCPRCRHRVVVPASFGDFLLSGALGEGAAGTVCKALDRRLHRQVAIKILKTGDDAAELVESCTREARALAALNHPNVVQIHNIGEHRGQPFIVMELLDGGSVEKVMLGKRADERDALDIAIQVAEGLRAAAKAGLVHMDVKPANILFDRQKNAKLIDFGVARFARRSSNEIIGTPYYVAPEVARGKAADVQADIYSLGATLFHLLAGEAPFEGKNAAEVIVKRLREPAPNLRDVRPELNAETARVVGRMLQASPAQRHRDYDELLADLRQARAALDVPEEQRKLGELASAIAAPAGGAAPSPHVPAAAKTRRRETKAKTKAKAKGSRPRHSFPGVAVLAGLGLVAVGVVIALVVHFSRATPSPNAKEPSASMAPAGLDADVVFPEPPASWLTTDAAWRVAKPISAKSSAGAILQTQEDNSILVSGRTQVNEVYEIEAETDAGRIVAFAVEAMADASLPRFGPGRTGGKFVLSELSVLAGPRGGEAEAVTLKNAKADYSQYAFDAAHVVDGDATTGWGISPEHGLHHVLTVEAAKPVQHSGGASLRFVLQHHPQYLGSIGRFRLWVKTGAPPTVAGGAVATKAAGGKNTSKKGKAGAKASTAPMPEVAPAAVAAADKPFVFPSLYPWTPLNDEKVWHTLSIQEVRSSGEATFTRGDDGAILVTDGPIAADDTYTIVASTAMKNIRAFRLDALTHDDLVNKGPGRKGAFSIVGFDVTVSLPSGPAVTEVPLASAAADVQHADHKVEHAFDDDTDTAWSNRGAIGKPASMMVLTEAPVGGPPGRINLTFTIRHTAGEPLGHFRLSATSHGKPALKQPVRLQTVRHLTQFVPLQQVKVTSANGVEAKKQPDGSFAVVGGSPVDTYVIEAVSEVPEITALKLQIMLDDAVKPGPGKGPGGQLAIEEFRVEAGPRGRMPQMQPVELSEPSTDLPRASASAAAMIDGNGSSYWVVNKNRGEPRTVIFPLKQPLGGPAGTSLKITIDQRLAMGRFRLYATSSKDPDVLSAAPPKTAKQ